MWTPHNQYRSYRPGAGHDRREWEQLMHAYKSAPRRTQCSFRDFASGYEAAARQVLSIPLPLRFAGNLQVLGRRLFCMECGVALKQKQFKNGESWSPAELAQRGKERFGQILCMIHYSAARKAARRAKTRTAEVRA
jgi:hypothetical protein